MTAETAYVIFIKPVSAAFGAPPSADAEGFFSLLGEELAGFSAYQLEAGARQLRRERTVRTFPTVAECIAACSRWPSEAPTRPAEPVRTEEDLGAAWHRKKEAFRLMRAQHDLSRQASREGWLGQLFDYVMENGQLPPPAAAGRLFAEAERIRANLAAVQGTLGLQLIEAYRTRYRSIQAGVFDGKAVDGTAHEQLMAAE